MAASLILSRPYRTFQSYPGHPVVSPYFWWAEQPEHERADVLFSVDTHMGDAMLEHSMVLVDAGARTGWWWSLDDSDDREEYAARLLIDPDRRQVYLADVVVACASYFPGEERTYGGKLGAAKRVGGFEQAVRYAVSKFFGVEWRFALGYKRHHCESYRRQYRRKLRACFPGAPLVRDVEERIVEHAIPWTVGQYKVTASDQAWLAEVHAQNVGAEMPQGVLYAWGAVVAVVNPVVEW